MVMTADIAARLGVATPDPGSTQDVQWSAWIEDALFLVDRRSSVLGVDPSTLDPAAVDRVVAMAVVAMASNPTDVSEVEVQVDDGRISRRFSASTGGQVVIRPDWWAWLGLAGEAGAFGVRPGFAPESGN